MMELTCCINVLVTFILISVCISGATVPLPTEYSGLNDTVLATSLKRGMFEDVVAEETDWRRGHVGSVADRSQDLAEQLAAPAIEAEDIILERAKRDRPILSGEGPNDYKAGPDLILGPSPAPGISLDSRIFESYDGQYHGHALRYSGDAANIISSTPIPKTTRSTGTPAMFNVARDDLRMIQSRINRWKLDHATVTRPRVTTPAIAWIQDPNLVANDQPGPVFAGSRRMLGPGEEVPKPYIPPIKMLQLDPKLLVPGIPMRPAFQYHPYGLSHMTSPKPQASTPNIDQLSPLELFRRLYITTTRRRLRTRKPRPKTPITILPMKDDEYIPEESDMDVDVTTPEVKSHRLDEEEADAGGNKPYIPKYRDEVESPDNIRTILNAPEEEKRYEKEPKYVDYEAPYMPQFKSTDGKEFIDHAKSFTSTKNKEPTKSTKIDDEQFDQTEIKIDKAEPEFEHPDDEESRKSQELKRPIFETPEIKEINKQLLKDLVSIKGPEIPKINKEELKDKPLVDLPGLGTKGIDRSEGAFKEMMAGPVVELKPGHGGETNEELKSLLMPEDESYEPTKTLNESKGTDYVEVEPEEIKGIPIRRRRRVRNNIF